jgi:hypothetical protein
MSLLRLTLVAAAAAAASAGSSCFGSADVVGTVCLSWASDGNTTVFSALCDPGTLTGFGPYMNWCAFGVAPHGVMKMYPAEVFIVIPNEAGTAVVVENRQNVLHSTPLCFGTQVLTLLNSTIAKNATSGGFSMQASWSRPRYITDPALIAQGHVNLTGAADGPLPQLIAAAANAQLKDYAPCDATDLFYHSYADTGYPVDFSA